MKTLVVVSALVALAFAAPSTPGEGFKDRTPDWHYQAQSGLADIVKREKKSPLDTTTTLHNEATIVEDFDSGVSPQTARSSALKKPLIVRKKYGHHTLFRDSEEEKALTDSHETTCARQVKVKLCDEDRKSGSLRSQTTHDSDIHMSEDDVKHSIRMAKEAVETLQRDLKKMDHHAMKLAHESETDTDLHEDIETARKALEHIHKNFGNLESMNLHATASRDSETMQNVHITITKTDEERMAQWKEAMDNIQKNVEIARNIEDSFKAASHQDSMMLEQSELATDKKEHKLDEHIDSQLVTNGDSQMRAMEETPLNHEEKETIEDKLLNQEVNQHLNIQNAREQQNTEDDMKSSASTIIETQGKVKNQELLRSEGHEVHEHAKTAEEKIENIQTLHMAEHLEHENIHSHQQHHYHHHHHQVKSSEMNQEMSLNQIEPTTTTQFPMLQVNEKSLDIKFARENVPESDMLVHTITNNIMKPTSDSLKEQSRSGEQVDVNAEQHLNHGKNALETTDDMIDFLAKSSEHSKNDVNENDSVLQETKNISEIGKTAEVSKLDHVQVVETKQAVESEQKQIENTPKSSEHLELEDLQETATHNENIMLEKSADDTIVQDQRKENMVKHVELPHLNTLTAAKEVEENYHHLDHLHHYQERPEQENRPLDHVSPKTAIEESIKGLESNDEGHIISEHEMDHARSSYIPEHTHMPNRVGYGHNYEVSNHGQHQMHPYPMRHQHNIMTHSNMHEMSGFGGMHSNYHPGMRDAMEGLGSEHNFRWKPTHETARGAYGAGLSGPLGSPGAVGVFPTANTGGCGIPLLLSCSPSVVSGSLAKPHSIGGGFGGPSYRTEEDFGFHNKRDIKKTNDLRTTNTLRTTAIIKQKSPILLENKQ